MRLAPLVLGLLALGSMLLPARAVRAGEPTVSWYRFEQAKDLHEQLRNDSAAFDATNAGPLVGSEPRENRGSLRFDGKTAIVYAAPPKHAETFAEGFTWEGFFFSPASNAYDTDGAIADRFISQYQDETGGSTRLTVGLAALEKDGPPHLCLAFSGTGNLHQGKLPVIPDVWHHFAVVHEGDSESGTITWYLDYEVAGQVKLTGKSPRATLAPAGTAPFTIGARLKEGKGVDRGFDGLLDEIRLSEQPLPKEAFLRRKELSFERHIEATVYENIPQDFDWQFTADGATDKFLLEALALGPLPQAFTERGYKTSRQGRQAIHASHELQLEPGEYRFILRALCDAIVRIDGEMLIDARRPDVRNPLGDLPRTMRDHVGTFTADGDAHRIEVAALYETPADPETTDVVLMYSPAGEDRWQLVGLSEPLAVGPAVWAAYRGRLQKSYAATDDQPRAAAIARGDRQWHKRHAAARELSSSWRTTVPEGEGNPIDRIMAEELAAAELEPLPVVDDATFFRRLSLDTRGRIPTRKELHAFLSDSSQDKRTHAVEQMLASDEWADSWVGYWQDVLAENPSILKPTLNNSGPFRRWIYQSFRRNLPMDRFATELILMEGSNEKGGTAGFAEATNNDAPMAMKAHVVLQAFLAIDMKCARCHDSPSTPATQRDLFSIAAMLAEKPVRVPATSVVPPVLPGGRQPAVTASLKAGQSVPGDWTLGEVYHHDVEPEVPGQASRRQLAEIITSAETPRFSDVLAGRVWSRYIGWSLAAPIDGWSDYPDLQPPRLMRYLSSRFVESGYDMKDLARLIFTSKYYQREAAALPKAQPGTTRASHPGPARRRLTAEQIVDSLHVAVGKDFDAEELTFDPNHTRGFLNLGQPQRAWQLTSLSNERDRPALSMPVNQAIVDVLVTFGWRETRPDPITRRDHSPSPLQPLMLGNGLLSFRAIRLTEYNAVTELCLQDMAPEELTRELFYTVLSRAPEPAELEAIRSVLQVGFEDRLTGKPRLEVTKRKRGYVDWDKHLQAEASLELLEAERIVQQGDPPTARLTTEWRQRVEDALWALINSPEFVFVP